MKFDVGNSFRMWFLALELGVGNLDQDPFKDRGEKFNICNKNHLELGFPGKPSFPGIFLGWVEERKPSCIL